jgi:hypothetical protein
MRRAWPVIVLLVVSPVRASDTAQSGAAALLAAESDSEQSSVDANETPQAVAEFPSVSEVSSSAKPPTPVGTARFPDAPAYGSGLEEDSPAPIANVFLESGLDELTLDASRYLVHRYGSGLEDDSAPGQSHGSGLDDEAPINAPGVFTESGLEVPTATFPPRPTTVEERYGSGL